MWEKTKDTNTLTGSESFTPTYSFLQQHLGIFLQQGEKQIGVDK